MNNTLTPPIPQQYIPYDERAFTLTFLPSFIQSFLLTLTAELGDKTFIMLIILQLKASKFTVFFASLITQLSMNILAIVIGLSIDYFLYKNFIDYIGILFFGVYSLWLIGETFNSADQTFEKDLDILDRERQKTFMKKQSSQKIVFHELSVIPELVQDEGRYQDDLTLPLIGKDRYIPTTQHLIREEEMNMKFFDKEMFLAIAKSMALSECGDRTQFTAMTMSAVFDFFGVLLGTCSALIITVSVGVFLGKYLIKYLNERTLNFILGGLLLGYAFEIYLGKK